MIIIVIIDMQFDPIDSYIDELIEYNAIVKDFNQITYQNHDVRNVIGITDVYDNSSSLICSAQTEDYVEFNHGKPYNLVKYHIIVIVGSSKSAKVPRGLKMNDCNYYDSYFKYHPDSIDILPECDQTSTCNMTVNLANGKWCTKCHDNFTADKIIHLMHPSLKISSLPRSSVIYIDKIITNIDYNDMNLLIKTRDFLISDKAKIALVQKMITDIEDDMARMINKYMTIKQINQIKLTKMLSTRGGSIDQYYDMINEIDAKLAH